MNIANAYASETVTAVIPAYNAARYLRRAIRSVLAQTRAVDEIIVVNDGSTDETASLLSSYPAPVRCIHQSNAGAASARNAGIRASTTKWVALLDADDAWLPQKIERQIECALHHPHAGLIYSDAAVVASDGTIHGRFLDNKGPQSGWVFERLLESCFVLPSTALIRRDALLSSGLFTEGARYVEDYDLWLRLARNCEFQLVPGTLALYERQETSVSRNLSQMANSESRVLKNLLQTELTPSQRQKVRRRLARNLFDLGYELRRSTPQACVEPVWESTMLSPLRLSTWRLLLINLGVSLWSRLG